MIHGRAHDGIFIMGQSYKAWHGVRVVVLDRSYGSFTPVEFTLTGFAPDIRVLVDGFCDIVEGIMINDIVISME